MHISQILTKRLGDKFRLSSSASFPCWQASHPAALIHASIHKVSAHRNSSQICPPHTRLNSFYSSGGCLKMPFSRPTLPRPLNIHFWLFNKLPCLQIQTLNLFLFLPSSKMAPSSGPVSPILNALSWAFTFPFFAQQSHRSGCICLSCLQWPRYDKK